MKNFLKLGVLATLCLSQVQGQALECQERDNCESNNQWLVSADFLWWKAVEDSLPLAIVIDTATTTEGTAASAHVINPKFKWQPGFRIAAGYTPCECDWSFYTAWTHFNAKASHQISPGEDTETIVPQWGVLAAFPAAFATGDSSWNLKLNWADFVLNRNICIDPCFQFGIHGGLRALWVDQKFHFSITNATSVPVTNGVHSKSDFSGIGVVVGLNASWLMGCGFSVDAAGGGAIVYGKHKSNFSETFTTVSETSTGGGSSHYNMSRAMTDLRFGVRWEGCVWDCTTLALGVDWEHHILFNQNQLPRGSNTANARPRDGDLTMQGVTFSAALLF